MIFPGISVIITQHTDRYRSGHNGPDSKSGSPAMGSWVRIPPCPPISCWKCSIRSALIEHFHYISRLFRAFSSHRMCAKFLSPAITMPKIPCAARLSEFLERKQEKKTTPFPSEIQALKAWHLPRKALYYNPDGHRCLPSCRCRCVPANPESASSEHRLPA